MGEVELLAHKNQLIIHSRLFFYGDAANEALSFQIAKNIADHWNEANGKVRINNNLYDVLFDIIGFWKPALSEIAVLGNTDPKNNYFRVEEYSFTDISFVDGINSNTGYFKLANLLDNSTTAAHEYGHTIGLEHPAVLDIRGEGTPGIMYPRGTIVDPSFQYNPAAKPGEPGATINPFTRKVLQADIDDLRLQRLRFGHNGKAVLGGFSSVWHEKHER